MPLHRGEQAWRKRLEAGEGSIGVGGGCMGLIRTYAIHSYIIENTAGYHGKSTQQCEAGAWTKTTGNYMFILKPCWC